jgi:DNA-binding response OmpR family regulator
MARILVVDDETGVRFFLQDLLERDHHQVTLAENGAQALAYVRQGVFDLALVDLQLGDMDGVQVLRALRQQQPNAAAIMLTAYGSLDSAVAALREGARDYLFKPCKTVEIRESIRVGLLKQAPPASTTAASLPEPPARFLQQGPLVVDFMRHVITLDGQLLELSPTEFDLVAYLASAAPRVVPQQELAREVCGHAVEAWAVNETVRYHVYRLRQKITRATGRKNFIRNSRGVGYALDL